MNLTESPLEITVSYKEFIEEELISEQLQLKYSHFCEIFNNINSTDISHKDREELNLNFNCEFTYGEIDFFSFGKLLENCFPKENEVYWDLGCGAGKRLVAASLYFPFLQVKGVEYLPNLYLLCLEATQALQNCAVIKGDIREIN